MGTRSASERGVRLSRNRGAGRMGWDQGCTSRDLDGKRCTCHEVVECRSEGGGRGNGAHPSLGNVGAKLTRLGGGGAELPMLYLWFMLWIRFVTSVLGVERHSPLNGSYHYSYW